MSAVFLLRGVQSLVGLPFLAPNHAYDADDGQHEPEELRSWTIIHTSVYDHECPE